jgi:threonine dehydratase
MSITQKIVLVTAGSGGTQGITTVNKDLREGWRVAQVAPMGGAGSGESARFAALVVLELNEDAADGLMQATAERAEADIEGQIEEALEGGYIVESEDIEGWRNPDLD